MPRTIEQGFSDFLTELTPSDSETEAAKTHRASIESCLKAKYGMTRFFRTGSFGNGTSINAYSDVDYFAEIPVANLKQDSAQSLQDIAGALGKTFSETKVYVAAPAIRIMFSNGEEVTEVVPADNVGVVNDEVVYEIPNTSNGWMRSSPDNHKAFVRKWDNQLDNKVRPLIRYLKAWNFVNQCHISSFYLELAVAMYAKEEALANRKIFFHIDIASVLSRFWDSQLADINDPMGISGAIPACESYITHGRALVNLEAGCSLAKEAYAFNKNGDVDKAFHKYGTLFGPKFPSYYY